MENLHCCGYTSHHKNESSVITNTTTRTRYSPNTQHLISKTREARSRRRFIGMYKIAGWALLFTTIIYATILVVPFLLDNNKEMVIFARNEKHYNVVSTVWTSTLSQSMTMMQRYHVPQTPPRAITGDLSPHSTMPPRQPSQNLTVTVVGAGAAGLAAAYELQKQGIANVVILEASHDNGGRVKKDTTFLHRNYPIELGATVVGDSEYINDIARYNLKFQLTPHNELVFFNYTFYDFFDNFIVPEIQRRPKQHAQRAPTIAQSHNKYDEGDDEEKILYGCQVNRIQYDHPRNPVVVRCADGRQFLSKYAIVTAPLQILRDGDIDFVPPLPQSEVQNHPGSMFQGLKVFIKFSRNFWEEEPDFCLIHCPGETEKGESYFWHYHAPDEHVLTGLLMGKPLTNKSFRHRNELDIVRNLLRRMEKKFNVPVSQYYLDHRIFNWTNQPFIRGTYSSAGKVGPTNIQNKIFLAGEAFPVEEEEHGWVHGAFNSGKAAAVGIAELHK